MGAKTGSETCGCNCNAHYTVPVEQVCCTAGVTACPFPGCTWKRQAQWVPGAKKYKGSSRPAYVNFSALSDHLEACKNFNPVCDTVPRACLLGFAARFSAPQTHLSPSRVFSLPSPHRPLSPQAPLSLPIHWPWGTTHTDCTLAFMQRKLSNDSTTS